MNKFSAAILTVEKRTYRPAGWVVKRTEQVQVKVTPKRIYHKHWVFDRETGQEICSMNWKLHRSYRHSISLEQEKP